MVNFILFADLLRQEEIEKFYLACQKQRAFYKGYPKSYHPLNYFKESAYTWQCPEEMSHVYLSFPPFHMRYKQPVVLPPTAERTSGFPPLPDRSIAARYNKAACQAFTR